MGFACNNGLRSMHSRWARFAALNTLSRHLKQWHFLKADLSKCFDTVDTRQLVAYVARLLSAELGEEAVLTVLRVARLQFEVDAKQLRVKYDYCALKHAYHEKGFLNGIQDYVALLESHSEEKEVNRRRKRECVVVVPLGVHERSVTARKLSDALRRCVDHVVIKIHDELYERMNGILQGSICSRNLCDLYLGIERNSSLGIV